MPIYEYRCQTCNREFEYLVIGKADPECPDCSSTKVCRLMSACGFLSKGSGGETVKTAAADSGCSGCAATSCSSCGH